MNLTLTLTDQDGNVVDRWDMSNHEDLFLALSLLEHLPAPTRTYIAFVVSSLQAAARVAEEMSHIAGEKA